MTKYQFKLVDSLEKVMPARNPEELTELSLKGYVGERISFQLAYTCENDDLGHSGTKFCIQLESPLKPHLHLRKVGLVPCAYPCHGSVDSDYLTTEPGLYPDVLLPASEKEEFKAIPKQWRAIWIDVDGDIVDIEAGTYPVSLQIYDLSGERIQEKQLTVNILPEKLPKQELIHTEWFHGDCLADYYQVPVFSEEHWGILFRFMQSASRCGVNMLLTPVFTPPLDTEKGGERTTIQLVDIKVENGEYSFSFDKLKRWIALCRSCGIRYLEISHLFSQWGAIAAPKVMAKVEGKERKLFSWDTPAVHGEYTRFLHVFLPELKRFLKEEGILEDTFFHISDEPKEEDMDSFHAAVESVKELLQDCKVMDALSSFAIYRRGDVKKPVVSVNHIEPFVEAKVQNLWAYYCTGQAVEVPNRFIAMPSSRNRILGVLCYIYRLEGFLHWGFNFYNSEKSREHIDPFKVTDAGEAFPSGDPFLVYPGKEGIPYESLRLVVLQEAMADLRVLNKAEQKFGRDKVMEGIERLAGGKISFKDYPRNKQFFYRLRAFLQEILAG